MCIYNDCIIGQNCKIDSGTIIGADGFGLVKDNNININVPHIGKVIIQDDVRIGSNCCIDRGTIQDTIIKENSRLIKKLSLTRLKGKHVLNEDNKTSILDEKNIIDE